MSTEHTAEKGVKPRRRPIDHTGQRTVAMDDAEKDQTVAQCGCPIGGLHYYACGLVGHVDRPRTPSAKAGDA